MASESNNIQSIDRIYAAALLELAEQAGQVQDINTEVRDLGRLLEQEPGLLCLLGSQVLSADQRSASLEKIFKGRVSDLLYRFLEVVNHKGRLGELHRTVAAFVDLYEERRGVVEVDVHVAARLDGPQADHIAQRLGQVIGRTVLLNQHEDPALIGGLKIRIADRLIDGSVAAQLKILRQKMIESGREKAQAEAAKA